MITSPTITESPRVPLSRGTLAGICARGRHHAYNLIVREFKRSGMSQTELAAKVGIDTGMLSRIFSGPRNIEIDTMSKLLFGMSGAALTFAAEYPAIAVRASEENSKPIDIPMIPQGWSDQAEPQRNLSARSGAAKSASRRALNATSASLEPQMSELLP
jgi:transcriptional regulator with XRE-family HTH domain